MSFCEATGRAPGAGWQVRSPSGISTRSTFTFVSRTGGLSTAPHALKSALHDRSNRPVIGVRRISHLVEESVEPGGAIGKGIAFARDRSQFLVGRNLDALGGQDVGGRLNNHLEVALQGTAIADAQGIQRVADVPVYAADALVRRAVSLQKTRDAATSCVKMHGSELRKLGVQSGDSVKVTQGKASVHLAVQADDAMPAGTARVAAGHPATAELGAMFGTITVERA